MKRAIVAAAALWLAAATPGSAHSAGLDGLLMGVNGLLTFPADPIVDTIFPPFLFTDSSVCASIRLTAIVSAFGLLPVMGESLPSSSVVYDHCCAGPEAGSCFTDTL